MSLVKREPMRELFIGVLARDMVVEVDLKIWSWLHLDCLRLDLQHLGRASQVQDCFGVGSGGFQVRFNVGLREFCGWGSGVGQGGQGLPFSTSSGFHLLRSSFVFSPVGSWTYEYSFQGT